MISRRHFCYTSFLFRFPPNVQEQFRVGESNVKSIEGVSSKYNEITKVQYDNMSHHIDLSKDLSHILSCQLPTFLDGVVPLDGPRLELLRVHLLDLGALDDEGGEVGAEAVAVLDAPRRPLVAARLPERVRARQVHLRNAAAHSCCFLFTFSHDLVSVLWSFQLWHSTHGAR